MCCISAGHAVLQKRMRGVSRWRRQVGRLHPMIKWIRIWVKIKKGAEEGKRACKTAGQKSD